MSELPNPLVPPLPPTNVKLAWQRAIDAHGVPGLRVTRLQIYRDNPPSRVAKPRAGATAGKEGTLLRGLETYVAGQAALIIDYAAARHEAGPISTAPTESTVQWLLHRRMGANQQMRWSPRGAHLMLKVRTAVANGTFGQDHAVAERWARRPFRRAA
jgi:hypothetical protein